MAALISGEKSNRAGLGAIVKVFVGSRILTKVQDGQSGYLSQSATPLYFGLGDAATVDKVFVTWPSGTSQTIMGPIEINRTLNLTEHDS